MSVVCFLCALKSKQTPRSCTKHLDKDTTKARNTVPFVCGKAWLYFRRQSGESCFKHALRVENRLSIADYFCFSMMSPWLVVSNIPHNRSRWPLQAYMFSVSLPTRACLRHNSFCIVFSNKFNVMSAFLSTDRSLGCKKSILAKVCFDAKRG